MAASSSASPLAWVKGPCLTLRSKTFWLRFTMASWRICYIAVPTLGSELGVKGERGTNSASKVIHNKGSSVDVRGWLSSSLGSKVGDELCLDRFLQGDDLELQGRLAPAFLDQIRGLNDLVAGKRAEGVVTLVGIDGAAPILTGRILTHLVLCRCWFLKKMLGATMGKATDARPGIGKEVGTPRLRG